MPVADYLDLLPLLLPQVRRSLLVLGWHPALASRLGRWKNVRLFIDERSRKRFKLSPRSAGLPEDLELVESAQVDDETAVLVCGVGPQAFRNRLLPMLGDTSDPSVLALAPRGLVSTWRRQLPAETWALSGLPLFGRPWVWAPEDGPDIDWNVFSPRGRIELPWVRLNGMLSRTPLRSRGISLLVAGASIPLRRILKAAAPAVSDPGRFWNHTKKNTLVVLTRSDPPLIVKIPLDPAGRDSIRAHQLCVESMRATEPKVALLDLLPRRCRLLPEGEFEGGMEEAFRGVSAYRYLWRRSRLHEIQEQAAQLLGEWQQSAAQPRIQGAPEFERYWEAPLRPLGRLLESHESRSVYSACIERLKRRVIGQTYPIVPSHGDFWINNLMWDPEQRRISGVLDWDRGATRTLPLLDLFQLLYQRTNYLYLLHSRRSLRRTLASRFPGREGGMIRTHAGRVGLSEEQIEDLFCRYWLGEAASNADTFLSEREHRQALHLLGRLIDD